MSFANKYLDIDWPDKPPLSSVLPDGKYCKKVSSAVSQVIAAIEMLFQGRYDCAVTLAGAAEGMLPKTKISSHTFFMKFKVPDDPIFDEYRKLDEKDRNSFMNNHRDWLKHTTDKLPDKVYISRVDAGGMIFRAMSHLPEVHLSPDEEGLVMAYFELWVHDIGWKKPTSDHPRGAANRETARPGDGEVSSDG